MKRNDLKIDRARITWCLNFAVSSNGFSKMKGQHGQGKDFEILSLQLQCDICHHLRTHLGPPAGNFCGKKEGTLYGMISKSPCSYILWIHIPTCHTLQRLVFKWSTEASPSRGKLVYLFTKTASWNRGKWPLSMWTFVPTLIHVWQIWRSRNGESPWIIMQQQTFPPLCSLKNYK